MPGFDGTSDQPYLPRRASKIGRPHVELNACLTASSCLGHSGLAGKNLSGMHGEEWSVNPLHPGVVYQLS
jgi:hypothetical protein